MGALDNPALTVALALLVGAGAQVLGRQTRLPGIVILLVSGVLLGPAGADVVRPASLGDGLELLVGFAVAVILFDGGLNLDIARLRESNRALRRLVTIGALVTAALATVAARVCMGWTWELAALFGALVIVTGPTVISPLVRRLRIEPDTAALLEGEGVLIDPIGALTAFVALEIVLAPDLRHGLLSFSRLGLGLSLGGLLGLACGAGLAWIGRARWLRTDGLERAVTLATVLFLFQGANALVPESGIAAVTVAGIAVRHLHEREHDALREFKEQLTILMIGMLFVLLAASVNPRDVQQLGARGLLTVAALIVIVRPLCVLASTWGTRVDARARVFMAWIGPRGIVAAAVASLFAVRLGESGIAGGEELRALVFLVITATVVTAGLTGGLVARALKLDRARDDGWLILGAHELARCLAHELARDGQRVVLLDRNERDSRRAAAEGFTVIRGNALAQRTLERAAVDTRLGAVALTRSDELNLLFASRCRQRGRLSRLVIARGERDAGVTNDMLEDTGCSVLGGQSFSVPWWVEQLRRGDASVRWWTTIDARGVTGALAPGDAAHQHFVPLLLRRGSTLTPVTGAATLRAGDELALLVNHECLGVVRARMRELGLDERATVQANASYSTVTSACADV